MERTPALEGKRPLDPTFSLDDFHIIDPQEEEDPILFQLQQLGKIITGHEITTSFELTRQSLSFVDRSTISRSLAVLVVRAGGNQKYLPLFRRAIAGIRILKDRYFPDHQGELDVVLAFGSKYAEPSVRSLENLRERVIELLREESSRSRVLNELGLFLGLYSETIDLLNKIHKVSDRTILPLIQSKENALKQSIERIARLLAEVPVSDSRTFSELHLAAKSLMDDLCERLRSISLICPFPPPVQFRIPGASTPLTVLSGASEGVLYSSGERKSGRSS